MTPAFATLFEPASAANLAISRLRETAIQLQAEGVRGKELRTDEWVTIVNIGRVLPETPPPGRLAPLLRAAARVAQRAADLLGKDVLTTGDHQSLETAADWARAAHVMLSSHAKWNGGDLNVPGIDEWLGMLQRSKIAVLDALVGDMDPDDIAYIESTDPAKIEAASVLDNLPPMNFSDLFTLVDAQRWSRLMWRVHADIRLSLRERDIVMPEWTMDSRTQPIRCDTDGMAAIDELALDPLLYAEQWDLLRLAERLAAGVEVVL